MKPTHARSVAPFQRELHLQGIVGSGAVSKHCLTCCSSSSAEVSQIKVDVCLLGHLLLACCFEAAYSCELRQQKILDAQAPISGASEPPMSTCSSIDQCCPTCLATSSIYKRLGANSADCGEHRTVKQLLKGHALMYLLTHLQSRHCVCQSVAGICIKSQHTCCCRNWLTLM